MMNRDSISYNTWLTTRDQFVANSGFYCGNFRDNLFSTFRGLRKQCGMLEKHSIRATRKRLTHPEAAKPVLFEAQVTADMYHRSLHEGVQVTTIVHQTGDNMRDRK
jgi:hypothetical protein